MALKRSTPTSNLQQEAPIDAYLAYAEPDELPPVELQHPTTVKSVGTMSLAELEQAGYAGLTFDWTSFPAISLKTDGLFIDVDGVNYGAEIYCKILQTKQRHLYRAMYRQNDQPKVDLVYSYDKLVTNTGVLLADLFKEWEAAGKTVEIKDYLELLVEMVAPGSAWDGDFRILSIPPTSKGRLSGHIGKISMKYGNPAEVVSRIYVGPKITGVVNPFYPWAFEVAR